MFQFWVKEEMLLIKLSNNYWPPPNLWYGWPCKLRCLWSCRESHIKSRNQQLHKFCIASYCNKDLVKTKNQYCLNNEHKSAKILNNTNTPFKFFRSNLSIRYSHSTEDMKETNSFWKNTTVSCLSKRHKRASSLGNAKNPIIHCHHSHTHFHKVVPCGRRFWQRSWNLVMRLPHMPIS